MKYLKPLPQPDYQPAPLTTLGKMLLGLEPWPAPAEACAGATRVGVEGAVGAVGSGDERGALEVQAHGGAARSVNRGGVGGIAGGGEKKPDQLASDINKCDGATDAVHVDAGKDGGSVVGLSLIAGGTDSEDAETGLVGNAEIAGLQSCRSGTEALGGHGDVGVGGAGGGVAVVGQEAGVRGSRSELDGGSAGASTECVFNQKVGLRSIANRSASPKFLLTWRKSQGLENDADVYLAELERRKFEVRKLEVPRCGNCEEGVAHGKCSSDLTRAALEKVEELVRWCDVLIGFESIGNQDKRMWDCVKKERETRPALLVVLVPNLEWCKLSTGWTKHTVRELVGRPHEEPLVQEPARCGIDVIIAKTECTFQRLQQLNLGQRFSREKGNLLLIPHTSVVAHEREGHAPSRGTPPRRDVIVFAGYSEAKNVTECVKAAVMLVKNASNNLGKVIIKCSHRCNPPPADAAEQAAATAAGAPLGACTEPAAKRPRLHQASPAHKPCTCQNARDEHNKAGREVVELVEHRITEAEKADLYGRCRLAICASKREGFGHTILEAAGYGCQVVTTDGMPMKSILRQQVGLAAPSQEASWNLGINYQVKAAAIVAAAQRLLQAEHDVAACRGQLLDRVADFRCHFNHFIHSISPPGGGLPRRVLCSNADHRATSQSAQACTACCDACGTGSLRATLRAVNWNTRDTLVWICSNPACHRNSI